MGDEQSTRQGWTWGGNTPEVEAQATVDDVLAGQTSELAQHAERLKALVERARAVKRGELSLEDLRRFKRRDLGGMVPLLKAVECALRVKGTEAQARAEVLLGKDAVQSQNQVRTRKS